MRLIGQAKGGFYAAAPEAIAEVLTRLRRPPDDQPCTLIDPCAGEAAALLQLAEGLNAEPYGIELSEDRASEVARLLPEGQFIAPADLLGCVIQSRCFSFVWCNPPYDYATGSLGRVEWHFLDKCLPLLVDHGIMALACPESVADKHETQVWFETYCEDVSCFPYPEDVRHFNEMVIVGRKREAVNPRPQTWNARREWRERHLVYDLPPGRRPETFIKNEPTDAEVIRMLADSPLQPKPIRNIDRRPRPPMSPGEGHQAMLLASGFLSGLICPPDEPPHVIRGLARKEKFLREQTEEENKDGSVTTRTVYSEKINLVVRTVDSFGNLVTLGEDDDEASGHTEDGG